jgi:hypothetical protein
MLQVSAGFRSSFFMTETRQILASGSFGSERKVKLAMKYNIKAKVNKFNLIYSCLRLMM